MSRLRSIASLPLLVLVGCARGAEPSVEQDAAAPPPPPLAVEGPSDAGAFAPTDAAPADGGFGACATATVTPVRERVPVDVVFVVDNSASMEPAVAQVQSGINAFASLVASKGLDYKVVMLSLRGVGPQTVGGKTRYPVCVPAPLGGAECANGPRFAHVVVDIKSTQPLEQLLGTLGQTTGYQPGDERGAEPWASELRAGATKSFVIVTDDDSRLSAVDFESFGGGANPNNSNLTLPPGLLHGSRAGAFAGYTLSAIYGWGSTSDPAVRCSYPGGGQPAASGAVYTKLIAKTGGARARICDGASAWGPFFDAVATAVERSSRVACEMPIPKPASGEVDPALVNVRVGDGTPLVPRVVDDAACGGGEGWYYDVPSTPTKVVLCPTSCERAQAKGGATPRTELVFGCKSVIR